MALQPHQRFLDKQAELEPEARWSTVQVGSGSKLFGIGLKGEPTLVYLGQDGKERLDAVGEPCARRGLLCAAADVYGAKLAYVKATGVKVDPRAEWEGLQIPLAVKA